MPNYLIESRSSDSKQNDKEIKNENDWLEKWQKLNKLIQGIRVIV